MFKWSNILTQGLLAGSLALCLTAPGVAVADPSSTTTTMTTTTTMPVGGYYDQYGTMHTGISPFAGGMYDQNGVWHTNNGTVVTSNTSSGYYDASGMWHTGMNPYSGGWYDQQAMWHNGSGNATSTTTTDMTTTSYYPHLSMYNIDNYNYYAGYGSMYDITRGYATVMGPDGLPVRVDLKTDRTMVRLSSDNTLEPKLDVERGFDRGLADAPISSFDPSALKIRTGTHVTFWAEDGAHSIQPQDGHSINQTVIITPGHVFNYTFTQPGLYRFEDSFGGGPSGTRQSGLLIRVTGDPVAFDDSMFRDSAYVSSVQSTITDTAVITQPDTFNTVTTTTMPIQAEAQTTTTTQATSPTIQVQGQQTQAPVQKVQKKVLRNQDMK